MKDFEKYDLQELTFNETLHIEGGGFFRDLGRAIGVAVGELLNFRDDLQEINKQHGLVGLK